MTYLNVCFTLMYALCKNLNYHIAFPKQKSTDKLSLTLFF